MIVIDTEMPTCCEGCFARQEYYNPRFDETEYNCGISGENLGTHSRQDCGEWHCDKPEWCPLKEQEDEYEKGFNDAMQDKRELMYEGIDGKWHKKDWTGLG